MGPPTLERVLVAVLFIGALAAFITPLCYTVLVPENNPFTRCVLQLAASRCTKAGHASALLAVVINNGYVGLVECHHACIYPARCCVHYFFPGCQLALASVYLQGFSPYHQQYSPLLPVGAAHGSAPNGCGHPTPPL